MVTYASASLQYNQNFFDSITVSRQTLEEVPNIFLIEKKLYCNE
jgi:hypothetical protein